MIHLETLVTPEQQLAAIEHLKKIQRDWRKDYFKYGEYDELTKRAADAYIKYGTIDPDTLRQTLDNLHIK